LLSSARFAAKRGATSDRSRFAPDSRASTDRAIFARDVPDIDLSAADAMIPGEIANAWDDIKNKLLG